MWPFLFVSARDGSYRVAAGRENPERLSLSGHPALQVPVLTAAVPASSLHGDLEGPQRWFKLITLGFRVYLVRV